MIQTFHLIVYIYLFFSMRMLIFHISVFFKIENYIRISIYYPITFIIILENDNFLWCHQYTLGELNLAEIKF